MSKSEPTSPGPEREEPASQSEEPQAAGGCGAASMQSGVVGELSLFLLLGMPLGLVLARGRGRKEK